MGNRDLQTGFVNELTADVNRPFFLFEGDFNGTLLNYSTLSRDINYASKVWLGNGYFKDIPSVSESKRVSAASIAIQLVGEPSTIISTILNNASHQASCQLYFGFLNSAGAMVSNPYLLFKGKLSTAELADSPDQATIILTYENELINVLNNNEFRYNDGTQQLFYPSDIGFEYMEALADWSGYWGKRKDRRKKPKRDRRKN